MKKIIFDAARGLAISAYPVSTSCSYEQALELAASLGGRLIEMSDIPSFLEALCVAPSSFPKDFSDNFSNSPVWMQGPKDEYDAYTLKGFNIFFLPRANYASCYIVFEESKNLGDQEPLGFRVSGEGALQIAENSDLYLPTLDELSIWLAMKRPTWIGDDILVISSTQVAGSYVMTVPNTGDGKDARPMPMGQTGYALFFKKK